MDRLRCAQIAMAEGFRGGFDWRESRSMNRVGGIRVPGRLAAVAVLLVLALGVVACGGSGDDGKDGAAQAKSDDGSSEGKALSLEKTRNGNDKDQVAATLHYTSAMLDQGNGAAFCAKLTRSARAKLVDLASQQVQTTCPRFARALSKSPGHGQLPVKVYSVKVDGDRAVARTKGGIVGRSVFKVKLEKENGEWRLPPSAFAAGSSGAGS